MSEVQLEFHGIHEMEPERDLCALLRWAQGHKIVPVWLPPIDGARVLERLGGYSPARPTTHDLLVEFIAAAGGVSAVQIVNYHEGVLMVDIVDGEGRAHDSSFCDALVASTHFEVPFTVEEELLNQMAVFASEDDIEEYFGVALESPQLSDDFADMMRSLGVTEEDFGSPSKDDGEIGKADDPTHGTDARGEEDTEEN